MPDLTSDIDKTWFKDHMQDIADLTKQISIDQTGKTIEDEDGTVSEEFVITFRRSGSVYLGSFRN